MRLLAALVFALVAPCLAAQPAVELPKRKPGLWEMQTTLVQINFTNTMQICIDEDVDDLMDGPGDDDADCAEPVVRRDGDRLLVSTVCRIDGSTATVQGAFEGDFTSHYQGEIRTTYDPPLEGMAAAEVALKARWLSACLPGQQPGDLILPGMPNLPGMGDLNLEELMKNLPQAPGR